MKIIFNYSEALLQVPPEVTVHTSSPAVDLLYALYFYLDLRSDHEHRPDRAAESSSRPRPTAPSASRRSSRSSTRRRSTSSRASRSCATPRPPSDPVLAESIAGELISLGDRDPLGPRRGPRTTRWRRQRDAPPPAVRARRRARACALGRDRHAPVGRLPRAAQHRHRALPPRRRRAAVRRAAQQHVLAARPRRRARRRPRGARLRPPAPGAAAAARASAPTRPTSTRATRACTRARTQTFTKSFPRCGIPDAFGSWAAYRDYIELPRAAPTRSSSTRRCGGRSARTSRFGTVEVRICDAQTTAAGVRGARRADRRLRRPGRARRATRACRSTDPPRRLIEENFWRAIRYGHGRQADRPRPRRGVPGGRGRRAAAGVDGAGARRAGHRARASRRSTARSASAARSTPARRMQEVFAAAVRETRRPTPRRSRPHERADSSRTSPGQPTEEELRAAYEAGAQADRASRTSSSRRSSRCSTSAACAPGWCRAPRASATSSSCAMAIEAARALLPLVEAELGPDGGADPRRLSQLQMAYAQLAGGRRRRPPRARAPRAAPQRARAGPAASSRASRSEPGRRRAAAGSGCPASRRRRARRASGRRPRLAMRRLLSRHGALAGAFAVRSRVRASARP